MLHFLVDGLCACVLYQLLMTAALPQMAGAILAYNVLAFLTQPLTGMAADRLRQPQLLLYGAVALLALGVAVSLLVVLSATFATVMTPLFLGLGNSLFHVWGGRQVAVSTGNDARALGFFVAPGALGLAVGMLLHAWWLAFAFLGLIVVLSLIPFAAVAPAASGPSVRVRLPWLAVLVVMAFVVVRSLLGEGYSSELSSAGFPLLAIGCLAMVGKMAGGFVVRRAGALTTLLALAVLLLLLALPQGLPASGLSLLLVNMTMAATLWLANASMPGREGLTFGLLAAALMPGYLLAQFGSEGGMLVFWLLLTLLPTVLIELVVLWCLRERRADVLWSSVAVNVLTNIPLHLFVIFVSDGLWAVVAGELVVLAVETAWYRYFVESWRQAFAYSFLCNGISCTAGVLIQQVMLLVSLQT